jgi:hypothetical protein
LAYVDAAERVPDTGDVEEFKRLLRGVGLKRVQNRLGSAHIPAALGELFAPSQVLQHWRDVAIELVTTRPR